MSSEIATRVDGPDPLVGKVMDERYRIEEPLGEGGIGRVYKARHLILGRHVALKVLLAQYESIPVLQERFRREAEALAALSHPNIVTVTDFGVAEGMPYLVMELLEGQDLATLLDREVLEPKRGIAIVRQVLRALAYAHSRELVHRDLKPHNVFVRALGDGTDHVEVLDFGLARFVGNEANRGPKLTKVGALIGTPAYMAPEQASGEPVDARADVYAAGLVLFETLTGRKPFEAKDPGEILRAHLLSTPPRLTHVDPGLEVSDALEALIDRALAKSPTERFPTAAEMLAALDALPPDAARRVRTRPPRDRPADTVPTTQEAIEVTRAATPGAVKAESANRPAPARGPETSIHLPKSRLPLLAGLGCAALVVLGAGISVTIVIASSEDEPPADPAPAVPVPESPGSTEVPFDPPPIPRGPFDDPRYPPLPPDVAAVQQRIAGSPSRRPLPRADREVLERFDRMNAGDPRGPMLLARAEANRGTQLPYEAALAHYQRAYQRDPSTRHDTRMLQDLIAFACSPGAELRRNTIAFVRRVYGEDALDEVDAALSVAEGRSERQRLTTLREALVEEQVEAP